MRFWYLVLDSAMCPKGLVLHSLSFSAFLSPPHTVTHNKQWASTHALKNYHNRPIINKKYVILWGGLLCKTLRQQEVINLKVLVYIPTKVKKKQKKKKRKNSFGNSGRTCVLWRQKMYGSGEIVATVNDYLFTNWAFVIKCVGGSIINSAARWR